MPMVYVSHSGKFMAALTQARWLKAWGMFPPAHQQHLPLRRTCQDDLKSS